MIEYKGKEIIIIQIGTQKSVIMDQQTTKVSFVDNKLLKIVK